MFDANCQIDWNQNQMDEHWNCRYKDVTLKSHGRLSKSDGKFTLDAELVQQVLSLATSILPVQGKHQNTFE